MLTLRLRLVALALLLAFTTLIGSTVAQPVAAQPTGTLLQSIPVQGSLPGGGTFQGLLTITQLAFQNGQLLATGVLTGTATQGTTVTQITQNFTNVPINLTSSGGQCQILFLDIQPIFLDLLGLQLSLSRITLDLTAVQGPGNLLGNLLCALVGLLDQGGPLSGIENLLNQINRLLR
jgi:hypothetical protein